MRERLKDSLKIALIGMICIIFFGYVLYEARFLIDRPELIILSPQNNTIVTKPLLTISGQANNISGLTINGRQIMIRQDGTFDDKLLLLDGYNTIEAKVKNKFGQETTRILEVVLLEPKKELEVWQKNQPPEESSATTSKAL